MLPWGHVALAYLCYAGFRRWQADTSPTGPQTVCLALAAVFPDVVDKPLAWTFAVFPVGRTFMHSLVVLLPLGYFIYRSSRRRDRSAIGHAINTGLFTHALGDAVHTVFAVPRWEVPRFLLWPLLSEPVAGDPGFHLLWKPALGPFFWFQTGLTVVAIAVWVSHGSPGPDWVWQKVAQRID